MRHKFDRGEMPNHLAGVHILDLDDVPVEGCSTTGESFIKVNEVCERCTLGHTHSFNAGVNKFSPVQEATSQEDKFLESTICTFSDLSGMGKIFATC